jgi:hypothetical protein
MHENKIPFFLFLKREIDLKVFETFFLKCFEIFLKKIFRRKPGILILDLYFTV